MTVARALLLVRAMHRTAVLSLLLASLSACNDSSDPADDDDAADAATDDAAPGPDAGPPADANPDPEFPAARGSVLLRESRFGSYDAYGYASAELHATDDHALHREIDAAGACRLLGFEFGFCDPACTDGLCNSDDECVPWNSFESAGDIAITGGTAPFDLIYTDGWYYTDPPGLPGDLFDEGDSLRARADGAEVPSFDLTIGAVTSLDLDLDGADNDELRIVDGADATVTWSSPQANARVCLTLRSPNLGHGMPYTRILECDAPDTGSLTVPRALVEAFPLQPRLRICAGHDCPPSSLRRYRRAASPTPAGDIELVVGSEREFLLVHEAR